MKKVLLVEDNEGIVEMIDYSFSKDPEVHLLIAKDLETAEELVQGNGDIDLAVLDGTVPGKGGAPNTVVLIPKLLAMGAVILAASGDNNAILLAAGASLACDKPAVLNNMKKILADMK